MPHWKRMMEPKEFLFAFDLDNRDVTIEIAKVTAGELIGEQGRKTKKPILHIKGKTKKFALCATNCKTIAQLFGTHETNDWVGKRITLFPTTTNFGGNTVDCIRVRPHLPKGTGNELRDEPSAAQVEAEAVAAEKSTAPANGAGQ